MYRVPDKSKMGTEVTPEYPRIIAPLNSVVLWMFRQSCGISAYIKYGYLMDQCLSKKIEKFAAWFSYPRGNHTIKMRGSASAIRLSHNGRFFYTAHRLEDGRYSIDCWDMSSHERVDELIAHSMEVTSLDHKASVLISGSKDKSACVWDTKPEHRLRHKLLVHSVVHCVSLDHSAQSAVCGSEDNSVRLWSVDSGLCLREWNHHMDPVISVFLTDRYIFSQSKHLYTVWDLNSEKMIRRLTYNTDSMTGLFMNYDYNKVAFTLGLRFFTMDPNKEEIGYDELFDKPLCCFHPTMRWLLAVVNADNQIAFIEDDEILMWLDEPLEKEPPMIEHVCFLYGCQLICITKYNEIRIYDFMDQLLHD